MSRTPELICPNCDFALAATDHDFLHGGGVTCGNCHTLLTRPEIGAGDGGAERQAGIYGQVAEERR